MNIAKLLLFLFLFSSCLYITPPSLKSEFTQCYLGSKQDSSFIFDKYGVWVCGFEYNYSDINYSNYEKVYKTDSAFSNLLFFSDGMFVDIGYWEMLGLQEYIKEIHQSKLNGKMHWFYKANHWGNYSVVHDTIKVQWVARPGTYTEKWYLYEYWFKIIDRNTIVRLKSLRKFPYSTEVARTRFVLMDNEEQFIYKFFPLDSMPDSNGWIKKKKWFWCDGKVSK